ncbi:hypothetical protein Fmac_010305 [Flemingia macrophylla]|uniref:Cleavage stimulation factor 50 kDa subunit n=1 Tax=Flemingia macrophylla TaxID=520843 RepID=A0ABD1MJ78_9FABA
MDTSSSEQTVQDGKLYRHLNSLIVAHLRDNNLTQASPFFLQSYHYAATAAASATMTPLNVEAPPNRLLDLVAKGLAAEKDGTARGASASPFHDLAASLPLPHTTPVDFRQTFEIVIMVLVSVVLQNIIEVSFCSAPDVKGSSKNFPKHETRHLSEHKNIARCARFSADGRFVATGSADTSIKLFEVSKIKQMLLSDAKDGPVRPVIRTYYDHIQPINDLDFHPQGTILISGAKDQTIKFFDISKMNAKRAYRVIQDTHNVRSISFHPSGDFLLAASKDGAIRLWDGITASCVRSITGAHGTAEATSAIFTKDQRFVLSCGKDSTIKLWEVASGRLVKQYLGALHTQLRCQAIFNETEEFILSVDELNNEIVIWDALTTEKVAKWPSNHVGAPRWLEHSPIESAFISCGTDRSVRFWKETV